MTSFDGSGMSLATGLEGLGPQSFDHAYGDRISPLDEALEANRGDLPSSTLLLLAPERANGTVVLKCPISQVPLTREMAEVSGITVDGAQLMVDRKVPLGLTPEGWLAARMSIFGAFAASGIPIGPRTLAIGGSSTHGFSSKATALRKKQFPQSVDALVDKLKDRHSQLPAPDLKSLIDERVAVYEQATAGLQRVPVSPWFGILHKLGLEGPPDVDVQAHSNVFDTALMQDRAAVEAQGAALWHEWPTESVQAAFPAFAELESYFTRSALPVSLEVLAGNRGFERMMTRLDWWPIVEPKLQQS